MTSTEALRTRARTLRQLLRRADTVLAAVEADGPAIVRRAEEAHLEPDSTPRPDRDPWGPGDPVGGTVAQTLIDRRVVTANELLIQLRAVEHTASDLDHAIAELADRHRRCLEANPISDDERADLVRANNIDGDCAACGRTCAGTRDDRVHQVAVVDSGTVPMCDACRAAWSRRPYVDNRLEPLTDFIERRRTKLDGCLTAASTNLVTPRHQPKPPETQGSLTTADRPT